MVHRYHSSGINLLVITLRFISVSASQDPADAYNIFSCPESSRLAKILNLARFYGLLSLTIKAHKTVSDTVIIGQDPNKVYTRFLCRGDDSRQVCRDCVQNATDVIETQCNGTQALIWYDRCLVQYSVTSFVTGDLVSNLCIVCDPVNISNSIAAEFMDMVYKTMNSVANETANNAVKKFETSVVNFSASTTLYVMEQCWPEKSDTECYQCLTFIVDAIVTKCHGRRGGKSLEDSGCTAWYSTVLFFDKPQPQVSILAPVRPRTKATHPGIAKSTKIAGTVIAVVAAVSLLVIAIFILRRKRRQDYERESIELLTVESLQFNLVTLQNATTNFSDKNKIGRGGFGIVYKGVLADGQEIAVKRLSTSSEQGAEEFKNEVILVAKLQHKNLVKLIGFCLAGEERLLVYKFVPNKSLDYFLFGMVKLLGPSPFLA